jgi:hypothetical protein
VSETIAAPPVPVASPRLTRFPVIALLAAVAFVELVLNRVIGRLIHLDYLQPRSGLTRAIDDVGLFFYMLTAVLAVLLLSSAIIRLAVGGDAFRPGARVSIPLIGTVFDVLAMLAILVQPRPLPPALHFHLQLSFFFLGLLLVLSVLATPSASRIKLGVVLILAMIGVKVIPVLLIRTGALPPTTVWRGETVGLLALALGGVGALLLAPWHTRGARLASVLTWIVVAGAAVVMRRDWDTAARVAAYGFGVDLPIAPLGQLVCLGALAAGLYSALRLVLQKGTQRLRGFGLVLIGLAGLQLDGPGQLALAALGLFCLAASTVRVDGTPLSREAFDVLLRRAAAVLGATAVTVTGEAGDETARVHSPGNVTPAVAVALKRRQGVVSDIEVTVGEPPPRDPPFTLQRRGERGLGAHPDGARVETEDRAFDGAFEIWDKRGAGAGLLDEATRKQFAAEVHGWLAVWPQRGVRYHARELPGGDEALGTLIEFLRSLHARTA